VSGWTGLLIAVVLLAANAYFVGVEFALISARRTSIEARVAAGSKRARTTLSAMENVSQMMAGAQLGITLCSLGLGAIAEPALAHMIEPLFAALGLPEDLVNPIAFALALAVVVFAHVVFGEMVPKNLALAGPDRAAVLLAPGLVLMVKVTRPVIIGLNRAANSVLHLMRVSPRDEIVSTYTRDEVAKLVDQSHREGLLPEDEHDLVIGALDLELASPQRIMMPLNALQTVLEGATADDVEAVAGHTGFSRLPVQSANGELIGYVHLKDVIDVPDNRRHLALEFPTIRPLATITAADGLRDALAIMQRAGAHLARVVDETGETVGVVALEDVLEELVGEIRDESRA
jgi:CBS domain containing-hemolysin-like protein